MDEVAVGSLLRIAGVEVNLLSGEMARQGEVLRLEPKAVEVLSCLARRPGEIVSKNELMEAVWADTAVTDDALWRVISELRRAFDNDPDQPSIIETLARRGYRLVAKVEGRRPSTEGEPPQLLAMAPRSGWWSNKASGLAFAAAILLWVQEGAPRTSLAGPEGVREDLVQGLREGALFWETHGEARPGHWTAAGLDAARRGALLGVDSPHAYEHAGDAMFARGRVETAVIHYQQVLVLDPGSSDVAERGQQARQRNEELAKEVSLLQTPEHFPRLFEDRLVLARKLRLLERHQQSRWLLEKLFQERPGNLELLRELTILDLTQGSLQEARERLQASLLLEPKSVVLLLLAAELELLAGDRNASMRYFDQACLAQIEKDASSGEARTGEAERQGLFLCWSR